MPARKRGAPAAVETAPGPKRRSSSRLAGKPAAESEAPRPAPSGAAPPPRRRRPRPEPAAATAPGDPAVPGRAVSADPDPAAVPAVNPAAPRHVGPWFWLMKAEPESRLERGVDVRFSIDDLRAKKAPEGWDGIRAYAARNNLRCMNVGDMAFFYHSNCKEPGIAGTMEIVREFSEDKSARRPHSPYYDPASTRDAPRWSLVHVEFRTKFAVPIPLRELRELGQPGGPLADMQMLRQPRLSVSRVSRAEWEALCRIADEKAAAAGLKHEGASCLQVSSSP